MGTREQAGRWRGVLVSTSAALAVVLAYLYLQRPYALPAPPAPEPRLAQLDRRIAEIHVKGRLADAFAAIERASGQRIVVDWSDLNKAGIDHDSWVELKLRNVSVGQALKALGRQVAGDFGIRVDDQGALVVSTRETWLGPPVVCVYDARALVDEARGWGEVLEGLVRGWDQYPPSLRPGQQAWVMNAESANDNSNGGNHTFVASPRSYDQWLWSAVARCLSHEDAGQCCVANGRLVVVGRREAQRRVARLLATLARRPSDQESLRKEGQ